MGGPSMRTEQNHQEIIATYFRILKEKRAKYGDLAKEIRIKTIYEEVSDETNFSVSHVKSVIIKHFKTKTNSNPSLKSLESSTSLASSL